MVITTQGLRSVPFYEDMQYSCSLTGITRLKEGRYKSRYKFSAGYAMEAQGNIIVKPRKPLPGSPSRKLVTKKIEPGKQKERKKTYSIRKQVIKNRMRAMVNLLQQNRERLKTPKLYFFTVTFKNAISDGLAYQVLNTWLTELRQKKMLMSYLWVAERQKNGTIHFHLAVPHYMNAPRANRLMRRILFDQFNKGNLPGWPRIEIMQYNGVDIAKNRKTRRPTNFAAGGKDKALANYLTKYVTKNNTEMDRLAWHCSRDWSALVVAMAFTRQELGKFVKARMINLESLQTDYIEFFRWTNYKPPELFARHLGRINYELCLHAIGGKKTELLYQLN